MTEQQIIDRIKFLMGEKNMSMTATAREAGYQTETLSNWFRFKTRMTLDGLTCILAVFNRLPAIEDDKGLHTNILQYLPKLIKGNKENVYGLFDCKKNALANLRSWTLGERGIKVYRLVDILDETGARLVIVRRKGDLYGRTM